MKYGRTKISFQIEHILKINAPLPPVWMGLWVSLLALAWLLPNHYDPWVTFHSDAWVAVMLALAAMAVLVRGPAQVSWNFLPSMLLPVAFLPFAQFAGGLLPYSGQATVAAMYVLGFALALLIGARWEAATTGRAADALLVAIGIAALVSVGLQLRQWLHLSFKWDAMEVWMGDFSPGRPSANLGQPNQLATLLLWALLAGVWGVIRGQLRPAIFAFYALYLLFGLVLTQSRMAMLAMFMIVIGVWWWRRLLPARLPQLLTLLLAYFLACTFALQFLSDWLDLGWDIRSASMGGGSTRLRMQAYQVFLDAVMQRPWLGYGWGRLVVAHLEVAEHHPSLTGLFLHSHNLFLDLLLWFGVPIGGGLSIVIVIWLMRRIWLTQTSEDVVLVMFVLVVGLHAMLELPLHHAYFLLPVGLVMGMLEQRQRVSVIFKTHWSIAMALLLVGCALLWAVARDYLKVEESFRAFKLEANRVGSLPPGPTPDVLVLNHMADFMRNARADFDAKNLTEADIQHLYKIATSFPTPINMMRYAQALAFHRTPQDAQLWLSKMGKMQPPSVAEEARLYWAHLSKTHPQMAAVRWPEEASTHLAHPPASSEPKAL